MKSLTILAMESPLEVSRLSADITDIWPLHQPTLCVVSVYVELENVVLFPNLFSKIWKRIEIESSIFCSEDLFTIKVTYQSYYPCLISIKIQKTGNFLKI